MSCRDQKVFTADPLQSVAFFSHWVDKQQFHGGDACSSPTTDSPSKTGANATDGDEREAASDQKTAPSTSDSLIERLARETHTVEYKFVVPVTRNSFLRSALQGFLSQEEKKLAEAAAKSSLAAHAAVSSSLAPPPSFSRPNPAQTMSTEQWTKLWKQFHLDFPREVFLVDSVRVESIQDVEPALRKFFARLPRDVRERARLDAAKPPSTGGDDVLGEATATPTSGTSTAGNASSSWTSYFWSTSLVSWVTGMLRRPMQGCAAAVNDPDQAEINDVVASASPASADPRQPPEVHDNLILDRTIKMIVLLSQQSALAFPYEVFTRLYGGDMMAGKYFVTSLEHGDPRESRPVISIELVNVVPKAAAPPAAPLSSSTAAETGEATVTPPQTPSPPPPPPSSLPLPHQKVMLRLKKPFRLLQIEEHRTAFYIDAFVDVHLFGDDADTLDLTWVVFNH